MGLFSKHKSENVNNDLPPPPSLEQSVDSSKSGADLPPPPPSIEDSKNSDSMSENSSNQVPQGSNLSQPAMPGGSLDDIKHEITSSSSSQENGQEPFSLENEETLPMPEETMDSSENVNNDSSSGDDLFNMFDVDLSEDNGVNSNKLDLESSNKKEVSQEDYISSAVDTSMSSRSDSLGFVRSSSSNQDMEDTKFLTTTQFKSMLEVVESVKTKVKESTETHLRLLDMQSEEDLEYENLRKSFQFIEDKLYELDSILFEK